MLSAIKLPKYQKIIQKKLPMNFPLFSKQGMKNLKGNLRQVQGFLDSIDCDVPLLQGLGKQEPSSKFEEQGLMLPNKIIDKILSLFNGLPNWAHPLVQKNLMPPTTGVSVVTAFLTALFNPDICSTEFSGEFITKAEKEVVEVLSSIVGYDPQSSYGFFTYGGTLSIQYGILLSLEKVCPNRFKQGQESGVKILCSDAAHFSVVSAAGNSGLGTANVVKVKTNDQGEMSPRDLDRKGRRVLSEKGKIACVVATEGTTDAFGFDDLKRIGEIIDGWKNDFQINYPISIHVDAAVGWAWATFNNYNFVTNPLEFPAEVLSALREITDKTRYLNRGDTISLNPHKYGFTPIPSSFILFKKNGENLAGIRRPPEDMQQLYAVGERHPGAYTIETTRYAGGVLTMFANMLLFGQTGYQAMLGRIVEMGMLLREKLSNIPRVRVINRKGLGGGTVFYFCLPGRSVNEQNLLNEKIFQKLQLAAAESQIHLSKTCLSSGKVVLKSLIMSPFVAPDHIERVCQVIADINLEQL